MSSNDANPMTHEEIQAILDKYGYFVPPRFLKRRPELEKEVLRFSDAHLNAEYREAALKLLQAIEDEEPEAFGRGDAKIWAAGFWHALGSINFLFDTSQKPHVKVAQIAGFYEVKAGSMTQRSASLVETMGLDTLDTRFATATHKERTEELHTMMAESIAMMAPGLTAEEVLAEMPNWGNRRSSRHEFVDRERDAMLKFYDLMEEGENFSPKKLEAALKKVIANDPNFLDSYLTLGSLYVDTGREKEAKALLDEAYNRALKLICDKKGNWPQRLDWSWLENRHILRTLAQRAMIWWHDGQNEEAQELFRKTLNACPGDNMGLRYLLLALNQGLTFEALNKKFKTPQAMDNWFEREAPKYPADFGLFFAEMDE